MEKKTTIKKQRQAETRRKSSADIRERVALMTALREHIQQRTGTQAEKADVLGITQPRLNDLLKSRVEKFSLDALVLLAQKAGLRVNVNIQPVQVLPKPSSINRRLTTVPSTFAPQPSELGQLNSEQGTSLLLRLLRCEAIANGLSHKDVVLSSNTNAPDGGIDAKVDNSPKSNALLAKGSTYYQIKTGSGFKPWQTGDLKKELFGKSNAAPSRERLGHAIKICLEQDGTYAFVTLGHDLLPHQHDVAVTRLTELFQACGYVQPKVAVYGQGQVAGELDKYPSLCLDLIGLDDGGFQSVEGWRKNDAQMRVALQLGSEQEKLIKEIRAALHENAVQHIRVIGEPGIGKTRLVLEAVSDDHIAPSVVYVPRGEEFQKSKLFKELLKPDRYYSIILVIDDCEDGDRTSIWSVLKGRNRIKLITIDHGPDETHDNAMRVYHCPPLAEEQIKNILFGYLQQNADLHNWAEWCSGSPRVAHLVGENLKSNPDHVLKSPADVPIWDRFIVGHKEMDSREAEQHRIVLRYIALFHRFGFESPVSEEGEFICSLVNETDSTMTWGRFQEIVQHYRAKRILQGSHTLFIVPKALHVYLWVDFWNNYGRGFPFQAFMERIPPGMKRWFLQLFIYAHGVRPAQDVVDKILSTTGPFSDHNFLVSETGLRFLNYLSEADPAGTLALLERTVKTWSHEQLYAWHAGRQDVVGALEKIAAWDESFARAVSVLIPMALAENAGYSNNSKGLLLSLFNVGLGWAATQAAPSKRLPILKDLVRSNDVGRRVLGLEMCQQWLKTEGAFRIVGAEYQGLKPTIEFWRPKTYGEVFDYWRKVLRFLRVEMKGFSTADRDRAAEVFITAAQDIVHFMRIEAMADEIMDILFELAEDKEVNRKSLIRFVIRALWRNSDNSDNTNTILGRIRQLDKVLTGTSLWERTERYVLYSTWQEDRRFHGGESKESKLPDKRVRDLAGEYMRDFTVFSEHLPKLARASGYRLPELGVECGKLAESKFDEELLKHIESGHADINASFVSGYFGGLRRRDGKRWETLLHHLLHNHVTRKIAIACIGRSDFTESLLREMLILLKEGEIDSTAFDDFAFRQDRDKISDHLFQEIIATLLRRPDKTSANVCTQLIYNFYFVEEASDDFPEELVFEVLTILSETADLMAMYYWNEIAKGFIKKHPTRSVDLLNEILRNMRRISHHGDTSFVAEIADKIVFDCPCEAWKVISEILVSKPDDRRTVIHWLADTGFGDTTKPSAANYLPAEKVLRWLKKDPEKRQWLILEILPKTLDQETGGKLTCLFIEEFCDDDRMAGSLFVHFHMGGWTGPESNYLSRKRDAARQWLKEISSVKIRLWLGKYIDHLNGLIEDAQIREEREF
ncbi:MAG: XRE family transcriptional regulator [Nitrospira sp.]|nr:XRE family transcriptional regulator [Nitrospira sp.]